MPSSDWSESTVLAAWADREFRHLDLVASWEELMSVYEALGFTGPDNDEMRLAEFKTVIAELNKFLTRMKNGLDKTSSIDAAIEFLGNHMNTADTGSVRGRPSIAYNKLKQRWIRQAIVVLRTAARDAEEGEREDD